jgi:hypothetical protein
LRKGRRFGDERTVFADFSGYVALKFGAVAPFLTILPPRRLIFFGVLALIN